MSFRRAVDHTSIAQLIGRMVRTPLARTAERNEFLNSVSLYLPHYDSKALKKVIDYLRSDEPGGRIASDIRSGADVVTLGRRDGIDEILTALSALPTYRVERVSKQSNVRRYVTLARALNYDKLDTTAPERARQLVVDILEEERAKRAGHDGELQGLLKDAGEITLAAVTLAFGHRGNGNGVKTSTITVAAAQENIDDLFATARRQLGEGLHLAYLRTRVDAAGAQIANQAKLELYSLLSMDAIVKRLEDEASAALNTDYTAHQAAVLGLPESRRQTYRRIRREAKNPEHEPVVLPEAIRVAKAKRLWDKHLFVDRDGKYPWDSKSGWEIDVLEEELSREDVEGWLRNTDRKDWALAVPYEFGGVWSLAYPDLLIFRRVGAGILVDVLEPHAPSYDDSWAKAVGLARYAQYHGANFGRIELIVKDGGVFRRLDVNDPETRSKVLGIQSNHQLKTLYEK